MLTKVTSMAANMSANHDNLAFCAQGLLFFIHYLFLHVAMLGRASIHAASAVDHVTARVVLSD